MTPGFALLCLFLAFAASASATFTLYNITYSQYEVYSTPSHLATYGGTISFGLSNSMAPGAAPPPSSCKATGNHLTEMFYGEFIYPCDSPGGVSTNFTFSRPGNILQVNQTWTNKGWVQSLRQLRLRERRWAICANARFRTPFFGTGSGSAKLECKTTTWQNPNWTIGQLYWTQNIDCKPGKLVIEPTVTRLPTH